MNQIAFGLHEVYEWAKFSNDFNPIHFDLKQAQGAGLDELIVHGMLALMPVKEAAAKANIDQVSDLNLAPHTDRWMRFHALFRSPIPHGSTNLLTLQPSKTRGLIYRLSETHSQKERFRGSYAPTADLSDWMSTHAVPPSSFSALSLNEMQRFSISYPAVQEGWIALDAIVFSDFMRTKLESIAQSVEQELARILGPGLHKGVFMQVSHAVSIDTHALRTPGPLPFDCHALSYAMSTPEMIVNGDKLVGSVSLPIIHEQKLIMLIEIGLLAKPSIND